MIASKYERTTKAWREKKKSENPNYFNDQRKAWAERKRQINPNFDEERRVRARLNYAKNREARRKNRREWLAKQPSDYASRTKLEHIHRFPERHRAITIADRYTKLGDKCENCGSTESLERHHDDYTKPLEVRTLCKICHEKEQAKVPLNKLPPTVFRDRHCGTCSKHWPECGRKSVVYPDRKYQCNLWIESKPIHKETTGKAKDTEA
jgi:hypothetical protein